MSENPAVSYFLTESINYEFTIRTLLSESFGIDQEVIQGNGFLTGKIEKDEADEDGLAKRKKKRRKRKEKKDPEVEFKKNILRLARLVESAYDRRVRLTQLQLGTSSFPFDVKKEFATKVANFILARAAKMSPNEKVTNQVRSEIVQMMLSK